MLLAKKKEPKSYAEGIERDSQIMITSKLRESSLCRKHIARFLHFVVFVFFEIAMPAINYRLSK